MKYKNNPFNIRYNSRSKWLGLNSHKNGFCVFESLTYGVRACVYLLERTYPKRGILTISDVIHTFAPLSDGNNTESYLHYVCVKAGIVRSDIYINLNFDIKVKVLQAMAFIESGFNLDSVYIKLAYYFL